MKDRLLRFFYFFHVTDGQGQLDIVDLSFMMMVGKVFLTKGIDWPSVVSLITVILSKMHKSNLRAHQPQKKQTDTKSS